MVNQSDLPFRILVRRHGATTAYTQMYIPERLLNDQEYLEYHIRDLTAAGEDETSRPVVVQLCGNDPELVVQAGKKVQGYCDAIDINLGCPQEAARDGHFGAYLLGQKDWDLVENIVSSMSHSFTVPVSAKMRLCQPAPKTLALAERLEAAGASWITLHARTVSSRRRRQGAADLSEVKRLKDHLRIPVISNGNVRTYDDLQANLEYTGADGLMVGETLLGNPRLFAGSYPLIDPVDVSLEYLAICKECPWTNLSVIQTHIRHFVEFQCSRRPWFPKFRAALGATKSLAMIEHLLKGKVEKWRGRPPRYTHHSTDDSHFESDESLSQSADDMESGVDNLEASLNQLF
ncbi:FMN-linked oxidoreductase [Pholiota conissans]|uniref:tRNA-dihydrouridine(16/17) synthase [NAD(P)(+)] n=1 Tax=Pholiota conissans TaxID=109636 RepID=A0A9P5Z490_9AGAR|nr:FMN-linked oxidoreductase [Pholiota conissans]